MTAFGDHPLDKDATVTTLVNGDELVPCCDSKTSFKTLELLKIETKEDGPIYFVIEGRSEFDTMTEISDFHSYFYEEGQCPTNFFPVRAIFALDACGEPNSDPHGLFGYVATAWQTKRYLELKDGGRESEYLLEVFPQIKEGK